MNKLIFICIAITLHLNAKNQDFSKIEFGTNETLDIATWNIEWFPKNGTTTVNYVKEVINAAKIDVWAIQEVEDTIAFRKMVDEIEGYNWYIPPGWFGGLAYIYNNKQIAIDSIYRILNTQHYWHNLPRSPLVMEFKFNNESYSIINNHFKCCGNGVLNLNNSEDEETRRYKASELIKEYCDAKLNDKRVIIIGDLNDILTDNSENNVFQIFIDDTDNYQFADMNIAMDENEDWSYPSWPSHIDHILISNELFAAFNLPGSEIKTLTIDQKVFDNWDTYDNNISDHRPVALKIAPHSTNINNNKANQLGIFPNPAIEQFNLPIKPNYKQVKIYSSKGILVQQRDLNAEPLENCKITIAYEGIYLVVVSTANNKNLTQKVIINNSL